MSIFCVLYLKKQHTEAEVDMLYNAIVHIAELEATDDDKYAAFAPISSLRNCRYIFRNNCNV
jgi:hypothetical protein